MAACVNCGSLAGLLWLASLLLPRFTSDTPTLAEMDAYVAQRSAADLTILADMSSSAKIIWAAPGGSAQGDGSKGSTVDLPTAFTTPSIVGPGTIVWYRLQTAPHPPRLA